MTISSPPPSDDDTTDDDTTGDDTTDDEKRSRRAARSVSRRGAAWTVIALLVAVVAFGCWLGVRALDAKTNLEQARDSAQQAKDALWQGDVDGAVAAAQKADVHARAARDATHSLPWHVASALPWLGGPFETGEQISDVVLGLTADVLQPLANAGAALSPERLLDGNRVDLRLLRDQEPELQQISATANRLAADADAIPEPGYLPFASAARTQVQSQTATLANLLENTAIAARVAPSMMGADGPRTYFMAFQTNAEARGTGGLLGGFGVLRLDDGSPTVDTLGSNRELAGSFAPIDLGGEYGDEYGYTNPFTDFRNSNLSSHFPYAARIWKSMWAQQSGMNVDGVIAIDPVALSYILGAVGPVTLPDGEIITKDNVVELTESVAYRRFPTDQTARKEYLQVIATAVVTKMTGPVESPRKLLDALGRAVGDRRISVWSSAPADQELLERTPLAHVIPDDSAPYAEVVVNNLGGNKMDYYLRRGIEYAADGCSGPARLSTITVRLTNAMPNEPLSDFVAGTQGLRPDVPIRAPTGTNLASVKLLGTRGATLVSALANGRRVPVITSVERGHPSFEIQVAIPPGTSGELSFHLSEPTVPGAARAPVQPLVDDVIPVVSVPECAK